jgi:phosphoenolpyruvate-protein kinase (PTS system EI component)
VGADRHALVDANKGEVIIDPDPGQKAAFRERIRQHKNTTANAQEHAQEPAVTRNGIAVAVLANVGSRADTDQAVRNGADGVGLYRTEQVYLSRQKPPTAKELLDEMRNTLEPFSGKTVCVRLLDIGADKRLPFIDTAPEANPSLGRRGIRLLRAYPELLETQLTALTGLAEDFQLSVLVPMVALAEDVEVVRKGLVRAASERGLPRAPELGAMIEMPAAALTAREIAEHADFLSVGTNDLTQYAFAADRENAAVEDYFDDTHEAIFKLIKRVGDDAPDLPLGVCGELAGRERAIPRLLQYGVRLLSVAPPLVPEVKEAVRQTDTGGAPDRVPRDAAE